MTISKNVQLPRSSKKGVKPKADELNYGNLAVNFCAGEEFLSTKNSNNEVVIFPSENYMSKHPITVNNLTANGDANISGDTTIKGNLNVSGTTKTTGPNYFDGQTYVKSGTSFVTIADFVSTTAHADGNDYITGGTATENTLHLTGKGSANANITGVVTTDKVEESVKANTLWEKGTGDNSAKLKGNNGKSYGGFSVSEGNGTNAIGIDSHAEGLDTTASGEVSHAEGFNTKATGKLSHTEGNFTIVKGSNSHGEGSHKADLLLLKDISVGSTEITINNSEMKLPTIDEYIKNCFVINKSDINDTYNIVSYSTHQEGTDRFSIEALVLTLDKQLKIASINDEDYDTKPTFTSNEYMLCNIAVGEVEDGHSEGQNSIVLGEACHAEGIRTIAKGDGSHAEGMNTISTGEAAHTEGMNTTASGEAAHAEGVRTTANGYYSHSECYETTASGRNSHAEGSRTIASNDSTHAEGSYTEAIGNSSHSEGGETKAVGIFSHSEGKETNSNGDYSHSEGFGGISISKSSHVEGLHLKGLLLTDDVSVGSTEMFILATEDYSVNLDYYKNCIIKDSSNTIAIDVLSAEYAYNDKFTVSNENKRIKLTLKEALPKVCTRALQATEDQKDGYFVQWVYRIQNKGTIADYGSHAEGSYTMVYEDSGHAEGKLSISKGKMSHAEGYRTIAEEEYSHAEGYNTTASGTSSHAEGAGSIAKGKVSHAEGNVSSAEGFSSHAEGNGTTASSSSSHAEGIRTTASGINSHAEGSGTTASGSSSHAEGNGTTASGKNSHAEGSGTTASGSSSHAEGNGTTASGKNSHAEGSGTIASGINSHTSGLGTLSSNQAEFACGTYNKTNTNQIFSIGIGGGDADRKNAISVNTEGVISSDVVLTNGATSMTGLKISGGVESTSGMIALTYLNSSDERLKKNIEEISSDDINKVKNVELKSFEFKSDNSKHFGVIAQNVENVGLSELVATDIYGIKSVDYMSLLILKIAELESEIKDLKKQINK